MVLAFKETGRDIEALAVGERSGITVPTRFCFKNAGYNETIRRHQLRAHYFDESRQVSVKLTGKDRLRDDIYVPEPVVKSDFLVNLPKFKAHPWTRLTLGLKNFIGLQDDRHRLVDHNSYLEHKIADLQEVVQPSFIAVDAIVAGQKMMLTPTPFQNGRNRHGNEFLCGGYRLLPHGPCGTSRHCSSAPRFRARLRPHGPRSH